MEAIEGLYPERLTEQVERLAYHAFRGELWEKAVTHLRQAGTKAMARSANREATACFEQALAAVHHLPETRQKLEHAIDLRLDLRQSLFPLGELTRVLEYLREAEGLARTLDDRRRLGWVSYYMSHNAASRFSRWTSPSPSPRARRVCGGFGRRAPDALLFGGLA